MTTEELLLKIGGDASQAVAAIKSVGASFGDLSTAAGTFGIALSAGGIVEGIRHLTEFAEQLKVTAENTGISTDEVQKLQHIADQTGVSFEGLTSAAEQLQRRLGTGDQGAASAMKQLGISVSDFLKLDAYGQMSTLAAAIARIPDPVQRAAVEFELFGRSGQQIGAAMVANFGAIGDAAPRMSGETVDALAAANKEFKLIGDTVEVWAGTVLSALSKVPDYAVIYLDAATAKIDDFVVEALKTASKIPGLAKFYGIDFTAAINTLTTSAQFARDAMHAQQLQLDGLAKSAGEAAPKVADVTRAMGSSVADLKIAETGYKALTASQLAEIAAAIQLGRSDKDIERQVGITADVLALAKKAYEAHRDAVKNAADEAQHFAKVEADIASATVPLTLLQAARVRQLDALGISEEKIATDTGASAEQVHRYNEQLKTLSTSLASVGKAMAAIPTGKLLIRSEDLSGLQLFTPNTTAQVQQQAEAQRAIAAATFNDIEGRMRAQGVETSTVLANEAKDAREQFQSMAASGLFTAAELQAAWQKYVAAAIAAGHGLRVQFESDLIGMAGAALDALASGGSVGQALQNSFVSLGKHLSQNLLGPLVTDLSKSSPLLGEALGSLTGPLGGVAAELGLSLGKDLWDHFFGTAGRDAVTQFATSMGGFDALHQKLLQLGSDGEQLWINLTQGVGRNNPQQAQAAIDAINTALGNLHQTENSQIADLTSKISALGGSIPTALDPYIEKLQRANILTGDNAAALKALEGDGTPTYDTLEKLQQKYNLTLGEMGPAFEASDITSRFQSLTDDMDTLTRGGVNVQQAMFDIGADGSKSLSGLGQSIQGVIEDSIKYGVDIPENMKPVAQALIDQGDLTDANGKKITDVSQLKFGESLQTSLDNLNTTLKNLIDKLVGANGLSAAINAVPRNVNIDFKATKSGDWPDAASGGSGDTSAVGAATGGYVDAGRVITFPSYFGRGGPVFQPIGSDTVPAMLTPGELILTAAHQRNIASVIATASRAALGAAAAADGAAAAPPGDVVIHLEHTTQIGNKVFDQHIETIAQKAAAKGKLRTRAAVGRSN